jgi:hypothetical protein
MIANDFMSIFNEAINGAKTRKEKIKDLQDSLPTIQDSQQFKETIIEIARLKQDMEGRK